MYVNTYICICVYKEIKSKLLQKINVQSMYKHMHLGTFFFYNDISIPGIWNYE